MKINWQRTSVLPKRKIKFCYSCQQLKSFKEFRSAGYSRKGVFLLKAKCKECEKKERQEKSPKKKRF